MTEILPGHRSSRWLTIVQNGNLSIWPSGLIVVSMVVLNTRTLTASAIRALEAAYTCVDHKQTVSIMTAHFPLKLPLTFYNVTFNQNGIRFQAN